MSDAYDYVVGYATSGGDISVEIGWEHEKSELQVLAQLLEEDSDYTWSVVDAGDLTYSDSTGRYTLACPFGDTSSAWQVIIWRQTGTTDDVEFDGETIPIEAVIEKLHELTRKVEENSEEARRGVRTPEGDSDQFLPPVDIRKDQVLGFDSLGNVAVGENVAAVAKLYEARDEAVAAAATVSDYVDTVKGYLSDVETIRDYVVAQKDVVAEYVDTAARLLSSCIEYESKVESLVSQASNILQSCSDALGDIEELTSKNEVYSTTTEASYQNFLAALADAEESGVIVDTPVATSVLAGKVKLGTDTVITDESAGLVGFNSDGQLVMALATSSSGGSALLSTNTVLDSTAQTIGVDENGALRGSYASSDIAGSVILSTSDTIEDGALIGKSGDGKIYGAVATKDNYGAVKLGSAYKSTYGMPYVVGVGISSNTEKVGEICFDLEDGGPLQYYYKDEDQKSLGFHMFCRVATDEDTGVVIVPSAYPDDPTAEPAHSVISWNSAGKILKRLEVVDTLATKDELAEHTDDTNIHTPWVYTSDIPIVAVAGGTYDIDCKFLFELRHSDSIELSFTDAYGKTVDWCSMLETSSVEDLYDDEVLWLYFGANNKEFARVVYVTISYLGAAYTFSVAQYGSSGVLGSTYYVSQDGATITAE